jgi:hypothetical protein
MRPRFKLDIACGVEDVMQQLRGRLEDNEQGIVGSFTRRHGVLKMPDGRRQFWSPQLGITVETIEGETGRARLMGVFAPHPHIWQAFIFIYGVVISLGCFGTMWGVAQLSLNRTPWALASPVAAFAICAFVYGATLIGQGLGAGEMYRLRTYLDECIAEAERRCKEPPRTARDSAQL